jgi:hypothetical protein
MSRLEEDRPVLEGLDKTEWHTLEHAYGEADDMPALLRSMASQGEETSGTALGTLSLSICHQGTTILRSHKPSLNLFSPNFTPLSMYRKAVSDSYFDSVGEFKTSARESIPEVPP